MTCRRGDALPEGLVERCAKQAYERFYATDTPWERIAEKHRREWLGMATDVLAVAAPALREQARAEGAAEHMPWTEEGRAALGYYRDRMTPEAVRAVQDFLDAFTVVEDRQRAPSSALAALTAPTGGTP